MTRPTLRRLAILLLAPVLLVAVPRADEGDPPGPMREEDVVGRVLAGTPTDELIAEIERREVAFDVSDEMLDELELAGVPDSVIRAMVARQRALHAERNPPVPAEPVEPAPPRAVVRLTDEDAESTLTLQRRLDPRIESLLGLEPGDEPRLIDDLAVYLACRTGAHVPDHWRGKSPLGRDFASMPRHRILAFVAGAELGPRKARLALPARLEADLDEDGAHALSLGVAVRVDDRYYRVMGATLEPTEPDGVLDGRIVVNRSGDLTSLEVRWPDR